MASQPNSDVDTLYAVSPPEFTQRRNQLAARLRAAGRRDEAAAVRRLKRPSVPVWAVDTLAREHAEAMRAFVDATGRLKRAHLGDREAMADATRAQRGALEALMRSTEVILRRGGFRPTPPTLQRISRTLLGAASDRDARQALLHGRLTEEHQAPGFEALAGARIAEAPEPRRTERPEPRDELPPRKTRTHAVEEPRSRARALEERRAQAALEARRAAQARADDLDQKARALEEQAAAREREAAEAARATTELQQRLREAEARARARRQAAGTAATAAKRARRDAVCAAAAARGHRPRSRRPRARGEGS